jgi:biotin synthase
MSTVAAPAIEPSTTHVTQPTTTPSPPPRLNADEQRRARQIFQQAVAATAPRYDWTRDEIAAIYNQPLLELAYQAVSQTSFSSYAPGTS